MPTIFISDDEHQQYCLLLSMLDNTEPYHGYQELTCTDADESTSLNHLEEFEELPSYCENFEEDIELILNDHENIIDDSPLTEEMDRDKDTLKPDLLYDGGTDNKPRKFIADNGICFEAQIVFSCSRRPVGVTAHSLYRR